MKKTPWLSWRWKVEAPLQGNDETAKRGDDFIARVYAVHDGGWALWRTRSVVYVWSNGLSAAESFPNAYTRQAHIVPLQRGAAEGWKRERRNLREDLKKYFGDDLDRIDAIALMSDCDDTGQSGRAWYGDIRLTAD